MREPKSLFRHHSPTDHRKPVANLRQRLLFAALVLLPLLYANFSLIRMGFKPSEAGLNVELAETTGVVYLDEEEDDTPE